MARVQRTDAGGPPPRTGGRWRLHLFNAFQCWHGDRRVEPGGREQRVVAILALQGPRSRKHVAGVLWPECTEPRAMTSLRVALSRLQQALPGLVAPRTSVLALDPRADVDVVSFRRRAQEVVDDPSGVDAGDTLRLLDCGDLLPGWYEDWVLYERESLRHLRLHALEALARRSLSRGDVATALAAAAAAVAAEPLRESAYRILIRAHLARGNAAEAIRAYDVYRARLLDEIGILPSPRLQDLMAPILPAQRGTAGRPMPGRSARRAPGPLTIR